MQHNSDLRNAQELTPGVKVAQNITSNVLGSEVNMGRFMQKVPSLPAITYFLDNSAGAIDVTYMIGDPTGMVRQLVDPAGLIEDPTTCQGDANLVTPNKNFYFQVGIIFSSINYQTSSTPNQFSKLFAQYISNMGAELSKETINMASARRNTADDPLLLTITGQYMLDIFRGLALTVLPGESVTITMVPQAYTV